MGDDLLECAAARRSRASAHGGEGERLRRHAARRHHRGGRRRRDRGGDLRRAHRQRRAAAGVRRARVVPRARRSRSSPARRRRGRGPRCCGARAASSTVSGMTNGTADMIVGSKLSLDRVGAPFNGDGYYVTRVCHTYDLVDGFRTHFEAERPTVNEAAAHENRRADARRHGRRATSASIRRSSPTSSIRRGIGRIQVKFPWLGDGGRGRARLGDAVHAVRGRRSGHRDPAVGRYAGRRRLRGRRPAAALHRRRLLERARVAARVAGRAEQQAAVEDARQEPARVRRHRRRGEDHAVDGQRAQARAGRRRRRR